MNHSDPLSQGTRHGASEHESEAPKKAPALSDSRFPSVDSSRTSLDSQDVAFFDPVDSNTPALADRDEEPIEAEHIERVDDGWVRSPNNPKEMSKWTGQPSVRGRSEPVRMALLTCSTVGTTFVWGIEQTYCTPYLLSLGLTKSMTSLVWIAGPLSGLLTQPIVGVLADESKSRFGRRRPFILAGALISAACLLVLGFTREIVDIFVSDEDTAKTLTIVAAVFAIYLVDFAVNAALNFSIGNIVMSAGRSLIVDTLPLSKQQTGSAWGGRMSAVGHGCAYATGAIDLPSIFGTFLGDTQFKQLTIIASLGILLTSSLTAWGVTERVLVAVRHDPDKKRGRFHVIRHIVTTVWHLPPRIRAICNANFWAWIGWFPFLFYSTTWIGETYFRYDVPDSVQDPKDHLGEIGRVGSQAFIAYAVIVFTSSWILPMLVRSPDDQQYTSRPPASIKGITEKLGRFKPDLLTVWICAHATFAGAMFFAPFARSFIFATILVCICAFPWTVAIWAPPAFLGVEVNKLSGAPDAAADSSSAAYRRLSNDSDIEMVATTHGNANDNDEAAGASRPLSSSPSSSSKESTSGELSGIYFGILNIYTTIPQFIGTLISTIVFSILEPGKSAELAQDGDASAGAGPAAPPPPQKDGPNAVAVCLFIGALAALVAVYMTRKLRYLS